MVSAASCLPAGSTGLTARVVATNGQSVTGMVDATGCDIGVYVGPGVTDVSIAGAIVSGAHDHGIMIQDTSGITVEDSIVTANGANHHTGCEPPKVMTDCINEDKALQLVGTSNVVVKHNWVTQNTADGGIGVFDDGPIPVGALQPTSSTPVASVGNQVVDNTVFGNLNGCGIVVAAYNPGGGVSQNVIEHNTVTGQVGVFPPAVGGIVVAADSPHTSATDNIVAFNTINGTFLSGVIVHSNTPGDVVSGTSVLENTISNTGWGKAVGPSDGTAGVLVMGEVEPVTGTAVLLNRISNETYGVWLKNTAGWFIYTVGGSNVTTPVGGNPTPSSGGSAPPGQ